jgi:hypothetical protein
MNGLPPDFDQDPASNTKHTWPPPIKHSPSPRSSVFRYFKTTAMDEKTIIEHDGSYVEANGNFERSWRDEQWNGRALSIAAKDAAANEKSMTIMQAIKAYKKAIIWSLIISTCVIMEGNSNLERPQDPTALTMSL